LWAADIISRAKPRLPESERAKKQGGEGFFRVSLDLNTGRVKDVVVKESTDYAAVDAAIVRALRQWTLRPRRWKEFEIRVGLYNDPRR